ncbi:alpha/beta-hydrolase [Coniochaeta ligniaria NRRL 30616]|uniref:Alpha/beta-hydrolase n=1 Tax=Coniochaeta ligniaria NRRL 30616 TaxID=1408157 RepID=A0A1J7IWS4_9PEZI|nr:alpha/beta-hydrolase [Coniochaeta ligniaria NRRL 30616]
MPDSDTRRDSTSLTETFSHGGYSVPYRIDGRLDPEASTIVLIPKTLTTLHIWDPAVNSLMLKYPQYRIIRYDIRGYTPESMQGVDRLTIDLLVEDLRALLHHLRIARVDAIVGIGLGATIALGLISRPLPQSQHREDLSIGAFVGVSFPIGGSRSHTEAIAKKKRLERGDIADRSGMVALANYSVARWFSPDARGSREYIRVRDMVAGASAEGLRRLVPEVVGSMRSGTTTSPFDTASVLAGLSVPSLLVCGELDVDLHAEMATYPVVMRQGLGRFAAVRGAARLAICESPCEFADMVGVWLQGVKHS